MNNPVRAYERSEWRCAGYRQPPVQSSGRREFVTFASFRRQYQLGGLHPRNSCLRHSYGVTLFRGIKPLNPCSARLSFYRQKNKRDKRISHINNMFLMFLCLNNNTHANLFSPCVFRTENIGGVAASRGGWRKTEYFFKT